MRKCDCYSVKVFSSKQVIKKKASGVEVRKTAPKYFHVSIFTSLGQYYCLYKL